MFAIILKMKVETVTGDYFLSVVTGGAEPRKVVRLLGTGSLDLNVM